MKLEKAARAKINLFLDVGDKREDGFHEIVSVMQSVTLSDKVSLSTGGADGGISVVCDHPGLSGRDNLVYVAAESFFSATGIPPRGVRFEIEKKIPVAAGLAGGSTDAASALLMLNEAYGYPLEEDQIKRVGANLGSDVPFCMMGGTCLARGRGEKLAPVNSRCRFNILIVYGGEGVSTREAYGALDDAGEREHRSPDRLLACLESGDAVGAAAELFNSFETVIIGSHPEATEAKRIMKENGGATLLCGSGPSVYAVFRDLSARSRTAEILRGIGYRVFECESE
ncbi:MAG: 4-(cytidine 5'-diphospho)-2-C-methyl-D-erythritol kinase [Clostridia bacterium]|nr:4-(cytidine 5'-diphospho)-2-C-methyl-D-erythritol kinase [Clostridia bacterium]